MRKYQSWIALLLCIVMLAGCTGGTSDMASTTQSATTEPSSSTCTEPAWPGYVNPKTQYTYYYFEGREHKWEEDILYFANTLITEHLMLRNRLFMVSLPNLETDSRNFYDEAFFQNFVEQINLLIPELESLTDNEIIYRLQYIIALFDDAHTRIHWYEGTYFPMFFLPFEEYGETHFYAVLVDEAYEEVLNARLEAINGYSVAEIREMIRPYAPIETEAGLTESMGGAGYGYDYLSYTSILEAGGVLEKGAKRAVYTLVDFNGTKHELELTAGINNATWVGQWYDWTYALPYMHEELNFWFSEDLFDNVLYIRISSFQELENNRYKTFSDELSQARRAHGKYHKVIVDLRGNGGGSEGTGFDAMINEFVKIESDEFYVLLDGGSYSKSTIFAGELVARRPDVILAGEAVGEAAGFFAGMYYGSFIMPNCGIEVAIPTQYYQPFPAGEDNLIQLDWEIKTTLFDYINGIDTVLLAIITK